MDISDEALRDYCHTLEGYSYDALEIEFDNEVDIYFAPSNRLNDEALIDKYLRYTSKVLRKNSDVVSKIVKSYYPKVSDMVYDLSLVVGPILLENGQIQSRTLVAILLMILAKRGFDKVLSDSKNSPDNTSDEGNGGAR